MERAPTTSSSLAWETRPTRALVRLSAPIVVSMLSYSAMTLVDTLFVARLGAAALAGVGLGGTIAFGLACFSIGLLRSVKIVVSQAVGRGEQREVPTIFGAGLLLALGLGAITALLGVVGAPLAHGLAGGGEAGEASSTYLLIRMLGTPLVLTYTALRETRYGLGDARSAMIASLLANVATAGLDALFIFGLDLGVAGAAWATNIACLIEMSIIALAQRRDGLRFAGARRYLRSLISLGVPSGLQYALEMGSFTVLGVMIARMGEAQMAAHQIAMQVLGIAFLPASAVAEGASVLAGQATGARQPKLVLPVAVRALGIACAWALLCGAVLLLGGPTLLLGFSTDPALRALAMKLLAIGAVMQIFDAANMVARAVLRGKGDVRIPALVGIGTSWVATPPLAWFFGMRLEMGAVGGWIGLSAEILAGALFFWMRLLRRSRAAEAAPATAPLPLPAV